MTGLGKNAHPTPDDSAGVDLPVVDPLPRKPEPQLRLEGIVSMSGTNTLAGPVSHLTEDLDSATIRFAGDSGDGMQLAGTQFMTTSAILGNDISTLPDFPAEIRAPAGTLAGVSGFQIHFSSHDIHTPGDLLNTLVAMNPAALKTNLKDLQKDG